MLQDLQSDVLDYSAVEFAVVGVQGTGGFFAAILDVEVAAEGAAASGQGQQVMGFQTLIYLVCPCVYVPCRIYLVMGIF
jgi:hypothetical protein